MLEKLATHEVQSITTLFSLADKCARAAEGRAWHSAPQDGDAKAGGSGATAQGGGRRRRTRTGVVGSRNLAVQPLQQRHQLLLQRLGARMGMANALARKVVAEIHAQCIPPLATTPLTAVRSRSSRSGSVGGVSSPPRTAHPLHASGLARRKCNIPKIHQIKSYA